MPLKATGRPAATRAAALLLALVLFAGSLAVFWPGYAMYDTISQYGQVLSGEYDDWHPPIMARLWSVLAPLEPGAAPMLVAQLAGYWLGLGLIAAAVRGRGRWRAAVAVLGIGLLPPFLGWQGVVLKDAQMTGALLAAVGLVGWWRLRGARVPAAAAIGAAVLIGYATLLRANAVFASVPLAVLLVRQPSRPLGKLAVSVAGSVAVLAVSPLINHQLLGASRTGVERSQAIYDLAGIAVRVPGAAHVGLTPAEAASVAARRCVRPFFWDPLGSPSRCNADVERLRSLSPGELYVTLADAALHHPLAYAAQRLAHLNSTERWWVPWRWSGAAPPSHSEPNTLGLGQPGAGAAAWQLAAAWMVETPLGWPIIWVVVALTALAAALSRPRGAARDLALALLASALTLEASFAAISIASDLRYHLWSMLATALAGVLLLADGRPSRRALAAGGTALVLVIVVGLVARATLPLPPQSYAGMLG